MVNGNITTDDNAITEHIVQYYQCLFTSEFRVPANLSTISEIVPQLLTEDDNDIQYISLRKRKCDPMNASSAPGPDGFTGTFFQACWDIVGSDVCKMVHWFFDNGSITTGLNSNIMILLPQKDGAICVEDFRPIVMSNFEYKIIAKILADRLAVVAAKIVTPNQSGFTKGRSMNYPSMCRFSV